MYSDSERFEAMRAGLQNMGELTLMIGRIEADGRRGFPICDFPLRQPVPVLKIGELLVFVPRLIQLQPQRVDEAGRQGREGDGGRE